MPQMHQLVSPFRLSVAKNTAAQLVGRIFGALSTFVVTVFVARIYGAAGYGDFVKITTFVSFFYLLADFGFNAIYIQKSELRQLKNNTVTDPAFGLLLGVRVILSAILVSAAAGIAMILPQSGLNGYTSVVKIGILILLPTIFFQAIITSANALFQKLLRYELSTTAIISGACITLFIVWIQSLGFGNRTIMASTIPLLFGSACIAGVSVWFIYRLIDHVIIRQHISRYLDFIFSTLPLGLTLVFNVVYFHIDSVILTLFRPTQEVGIYGLAYKVFELILVFPTFFMNAVYPILIEKTQESLRKLIRKLTGFLLLASCLLSIIVWFSAPLISVIRSDFVASIFPLRILALGLPLFFLSSLSMWVLITLKKQWALVYVYGTSMLVNILLNSIFVPRGGYVAAAWITVASEAIVLLASAVLVYKELRRT